MNQTTLGVIYAILACAAWAVAYVTPVYLSFFSPVEIVFFRYAIYGIISSFFFVLNGKKIFHTKKIFFTSVLFALSSNIFYYILLVIGMRLAGEEIAIVIIGILPLTVTYFGNLSEKYIPVKKIAMPLFYILAGLLVVNVARTGILHSEINISVLGYLCLFGAVILWTWFGVANTNFLKTHRQISSMEWANATGATTLMTTLLFAIPFFLFSDQHRLDTLCATLKRESSLIHFLILAIFPSFLAGILWNKASKALPISISGQLTILETVFGVTYIYIAKKEWPGGFELAGIALILFGIRSSLLIFKKHMHTQGF
ncbi:MAG: DMT family transporter [Leptospiraceae bacterium]|nr:DMT family transporter [Leptospiraceae bacterium]